MKLLKMIKNLCQPAYVYFVMTILSLVLYLSIRSYAIRDGRSNLQAQLPKFSMIIKGIIVSIVWIYILNWLCKKSPTGKIVAWVLVVLPILGYVIIMVGLLLLVYISSQVDGKIKVNTNQKDIPKDRDDLLVQDRTNQPEQLSQSSGSTVN